MISEFIVNETKLETVDRSIQFLESVQRCLIKEIIRSHWALEIGIAKIASIGDGAEPVARFLVSIAIL